MVLWKVLFLIFTTEKSELRCIESDLKKIGFCDASLDGLVLAMKLELTLNLRQSSCLKLLSPES